MDIVIVGGGYAGVACAARLAWRARAQRTPARVRLINPRPVLVERIRSHQAATGQALRERRLDKLLARCGVELVIGSAQAIDPLARTVRVGDEVLSWDRLVLAPGSCVAASAVPGVAAHALTLDPQTAPQLYERLMSLPPRGRVVVVGGGLTGIESASEIAESLPHLDVHLVSESRVAGDYSAAGREHVMSTLQRLGVTAHEQVHVHALTPNWLETTAGALDSDACVWAAGFGVPALAREAGLRVNAIGQVLVDPLLRSVSHPWVYAAGDIARPAIAPGQALPLGCKSAMPMGALVGDNLARELVDRDGEALDYALLFYCVSLGRRDGLIQWADDSGSPTDRVLTGRRAAWFKEFICRTTWWALQMEARGFKGVVWKRTGHAPQMLPEQPAV